MEILYLISNKLQRDCYEINLSSNTPSFIVSIRFIIDRQIGQTAYRITRKVPMGAV